MKRWLGVVALAVAMVGCHEEFEPPDRGARVERAAERFDVALFDSLTWADGDVRLREGNVVYAERCRRCHGALGQGGTDYARERDLEVPSMVEPEWPFAQLDSLRRRIYTGHESGMPVFGDGQLGPREIDAAAGYILLTLRPDVLGQG